MISNLFVRFGDSRARERAEIFTEGAEHYVRYADDAHLRYHRKIESGSRYHEKQHKQRRRPAFGAFEDHFGVSAGIDEYRSYHHTSKKGRKIAAENIEFAKPHSRKHERHHTAEAVGARTEKLTAKSKQEAERRSYRETHHYLEKRHQQYARHGEFGARRHHFGYSRTNGEYHKPYRVVERHHGKQGIRHDAVGFELSYDHERRRGSGCGCYRGQKQYRGRVDELRSRRAHHKQRAHHERHGTQRLREGYHQYLRSETFEARKFEFAAYRKSYESERYIRYETYSGESISAEEPYAIRSHYYSRREIAGHAGEIEQLHHPVEYKTENHCESYTQNRSHIHLRRKPAPRARFLFRF